jgi:26S proteasome regulatory subunit, ATPase 3, interacting protein
MDVFRIADTLSTQSYSLWSLATDALPPAEASALDEELGIETDTSEHALLEKSVLCQLVSTSVLGKRRR